MSFLRTMVWASCLIKMAPGRGITLLVDCIYYVSYWWNDALKLRFRTFECFLKTRTVYKFFLWKPREILNEMSLKNLIFTGPCNFLNFLKATLFIYHSLRQMFFSGNTRKMRPRNPGRLHVGSWDLGPGTPKCLGGIRNSGPQNIQVAPGTRDPQSGTRNPGPQNI